MRRLTEDPRAANCQVYLFAWTRTSFPSLQLCTPHANTYSDPLQHMSFHLNLIVTSYLSLSPYGLLFFTIAPNNCTQKQEARLVSLLFVHKDHTNARLALGFSPFKPHSYFTHIELTFFLPWLRVIHTALHLTYRVDIISTHKGPPSPTRPRISRQNVSLAAVLE